MRTKFVPVQPKSHDVRTIHAPSPAAASPCSFVRPYTDSGFGASDSTYGVALRPVEDVVGREVDERRAELRRVLRAADVDRRGVLRVASAPSTSVHAAACSTRSTSPSGGGGNVTSQSARVRPRAPGNASSERGAELAAGAGYDDASRAERIGDVVLQRWRTRSSSHGTPCSSGIRRVVLLGDEVHEEAVGERLVAVRVHAGHVDRDRVVVADVLA